MKARTLGREVKKRAFAGRRPAERVPQGPGRETGRMAAGRRDTSQEKTDGQRAIGPGVGKQGAPSTFYLFVRPTLPSTDWQPALAGLRYSVRFSNSS